MDTLKAYKLVIVLCIFFGAFSADAATLRLNPSTGVYTVGNTFVASVLLNTEGKSVNAADGQLSFNPRELQVVAVSRSTSIFNLWTEEPTYSNSAGTVSFGGGSPSGYKGASGSIVTVTFRPLGAGTPKVNFKSGSVLAADGLGTNVLTSMNGGAYTISAASANPEPEYVAPANTPKAPTITSTTHPDQAKWYKEKTVKLAWLIPSDVTAIRTLLDESVATVPTIVYDTLISNKTIEDLDEGVSYFHIQFKNKEGWGKIAHYKLAVDSIAPTDFVISEAEKTDVIKNLTFQFSIKDISPIIDYKIQFDGKEPLTFNDTEQTKKYTPEALSPGHHTLVVEAFDSAGNSVVGSYSFDVEAFEKPIFTEYPARLNTEVIPAIKGTTRPNAFVAVEVKRVSDGTIVMTSADNGSADTYTIMSDDTGLFTYIPNDAFERGVYSITARARDVDGNISELSDEITLVVETPGYIVFGTIIINILSILIPLIALLILLIFGTWYLSLIHI